MDAIYLKNDYMRRIERLQMAKKAAQKKAKKAELRAIRQAVTFMAIVTVIAYLIY